MDARELGSIPYHPLPLALGVARYPPYPLLAGAGAAARLVWLTLVGEMGACIAHRPAAALAVGRRSRTTRGSGSRVCAGSTKSVLERGLTTQACNVAPPHRADKRCRVDAPVEKVTPQTRSCTCILRAPGKLSTVGPAGLRL